MKNQIFIDKAKIVHKNKYDYSKINYINCKTKIKINCFIHGIFEQRPSDHLAGSNCPKCSKENQKIKIIISKEEAFKRIYETHGNKYTYDLDSYVSAKNSIIIFCSIHGKFLQKAENHWRGSNCPKCQIQNQKLTLEDFIIRANQIHDNKYDYSITKYINYTSKLKIICPEHGIFEQEPSSHLRGSGCKTCKNFVSKSEFKIRKIFNNYTILTSYRPRWLNSYINTSTLELDIYIPDLNLAIEFNGLYWHNIDKIKEKGYDENYHLYKFNKCKENNINLIHIFEFEDLEEWLKIIKEYINNPQKFIISFENEKRLITRYNQVYTLYGKSKVEYKTST